MKSLCWSSDAHISEPEAAFTAIRVREHTVDAHDDIDALLNQMDSLVGNVSQESSSVRESSPGDQTEDTRTPTSDKTSSSAGVSSGREPLDDPEAVLDRVDQELADLESMLEDTLRDVDTGSDIDEALASDALEDAITENPPFESSDRTANTDGAIPLDASEAPTLEQDESAPTATDDVGPTEPLKDARLDAPETASIPSDDTRPQGPVPESSAEAPDMPDVGDTRSRTLFVAAFTARLVAVLRCLAPPFVWLLVTLDRPFSSLSPRTRTMMGYVGIVTMAMAAATWIIGNSLHQQ
jgi:hypothetical protein